MTQPHMPIEPTVASLHRRGGARGTGAESGSPPVGAQPWLLDSRQVAGLLGISRTKAFDLMARNHLPVVRIGRCVRVSSKALETWITDQTIRNQRLAERRPVFEGNDG